MFCDTAKRWREIDGENLGTRRGQTKTFADVCRQHVRGGQVKRREGLTVCTVVTTDVLMDATKLVGLELRDQKPNSKRHTDGRTKKKSSKWRTRTA